MATPIMTASRTAPISSPGSDNFVSAPVVAASDAVPEPATSMLVIVAAIAIRRIGGRMCQELVSA